MLYRVELWQDGRRIQSKDFDSLAETRRYYRCFFQDDSLGVELYENDCRLRYVEAWRLMGVGLRPMRFGKGRGYVTEKTDPQAGGGCDCRYRV